jgi:hypothetical protein
VWGTARHEAWALVIAVNSAGWIYDCDWLVFADHGIGDPIRRGEADPPRIGYVTHPRTVLPSPLRRGQLPLRNVRCRYAELLPRGEDPCSCCYSYPNALAFALSVMLDVMPATVEVHVYGFDCNPAPHGVALEGGNHKIDRWISELPWIKHCWTERTQAHSDLPEVVRAWLEAPGLAMPQYDAAIECLRGREAAATASPCPAPASL